MATVRNDSRSQIAANEGHVGEILLLRAVDSVFDEAHGPLTSAEIAATLFEQGFPAASATQLRDELRGVLAKHPEAFARGAAGWRRLDPSGHNSPPPTSPR